MLTAAHGCGPEFVAGTGGSGGDGGTGNTGGGGAGGAGGAPCMDADGDAVTDCDGDCNDGYALAYPGAGEICDGADNDCDGDGDDPMICGGLGTFVAPDGQDGNPGTWDRPFRTIAQGINVAQMIGVGIVYIAEGSYDEAIDLPPDVSLRGGHMASSWLRDPVSHESIVDCDTAGAFVCVRAGAGIGREGVLDGLTIQGASGDPADPPGSVAVQLDGAEPTITGCRILAGSITGMAGAQRSIAVHVLGQPIGAGPLLEGNEIVGGEGPNDASIGVYIEAAAAAEIMGNIIRSGPGKNSWGILDDGAAAGTKVIANEIQGGDAAAQGVSFGIGTAGATLIARNSVNTDLDASPTCADAALWCGGIASYSSAAQIENNVVFGAVAARSAAVHLLELNVATLGDVHVNANYLNALGNASGAGRSAAIVLASPYTGASMPFAVIRNNILIGGVNGNRYGVYEDTVGPNQTCTPKFFTHNLFFFESGMSGVLYRQWTGSVPEINIGTLAGLPPEYSNNLFEDPLVDATFHLMDGSPCIDAGTHQDAPDDDFEEDPRPLANPVDIGPDEAQ